jgi:NRPS condensation-like uncharacterized protein/acyl carrier protein
MSAQSVLRDSEAELLACVLGIWREVLASGDAVLTADSNFFLSGGDSLQLIRVLVRVRERLGTDLPLHEAARFSTPAKMAACCVAGLHRASRIAQPGPHRIVQDQDSARFPCTAGQAALWLAEQCSEATGVYNTAVVVHLTGELHVPALARALELMLQRHEILRATLQFDTRERRLFARVGALVAPLLEPIRMSAGEVTARFRALASQPFDLAAGPLWRVELAITGSRAWALLICVHHCITDGWSGAVLLRHLAAAYNALLVDQRWQLPERDREFRQFCLQQRTLPLEELNWWRTQLDGADRLRAWPCTGAQRWPFAMACAEQVIDERLLVAVHAARRAAQVELSAFLLAALRRAVHALTGIDELCIGMPVSLRNTSAQEEGMGYFVNLLVLRERIIVGADSVIMLQQVQRNLSEALRHRGAALPELAQQLRPRLLPSGNPWCDVLFAYQNLPWDLLPFTGLQATLEPLTLASQYPLKVEFIPMGSTCLCRIEYARHVLTRDEAHDLQSAIRDQLASLSAPTRSN